MLDYRQILIAVDSETLRNFFFVTFKHVRDIDAVIVDDGQEALDTLRSGQAFSAAMVHSELKEISGIAVLDAVRSDPWLADLPVVMLFPPDTAGSELEARELGAAACFTTPFSPLQMVRRLASYRVPVAADSASADLERLDADLEAAVA